jgi:hypothetical protein
MSAKTAALVFGVVFVLVGALGYFSNPVVGAAGSGAIFEVDAMHNYVHFGAGAVLIVLAVLNMASLALILVGAIYGVVAVLGLVMIPGGGMLLGMVHMNANDHYLHAALAVVLLAAGFLLKGNAPASASPGA